MHCPSDGVEMGQTAIVGMDKSWRCERCGGCWIEGWVINKIAEGGRLTIEDRKLKTEYRHIKELLCPEDGAKMVRGLGDLPDDIVMWKCDKCRKWWLPGETIFSVKQAFDVWREYQRLWKKRSGFTSFALPVVLTLVLVLGLGMVIREVGRRQTLTTLAAVVEKSEVRYLGSGRVEVRLLVFGDLGQVEYRRFGERTWRTAPVVATGGWQVAMVEGVEPGEKFLIRWNGATVQLTVGQAQ